MLTVRPLCKVLWKTGGEKEQSSYCIAPLFLLMKDLHQKTQIKSGELSRASSNTSQRWQELRIDPLKKIIIKKKWLLLLLWVDCVKCADE